MMHAAVIASFDAEKAASARQDRLLRRLRFRYKLVQIHFLIIIYIYIWIEINILASKQSFR